MVGLKPSHRQFVREYRSNGSNATQAYMKAYPDAQYSTARSKGCELVAKENIKSEIDRQEDKRDCKDISSRQALLDEAHETGVKASEDGQHRTRLAAIDIKAKLSGAYNQDAPDLDGYRMLIKDLTININPAPPSEGERQVEGEVIEVSKQEGEDAS